MENLISIVVASYNYDQFLPKTLDSIIQQTHKEWEAIVVDDGSSDNSVSIIKQYAARDKRIRLLQHPDGTNRGLSATIQLGLSSANGSWIAFCESDDWWCPLFLQYLMKHSYKNPESGVIFSDVMLEGISPTMEHHCHIIRNHFRKNGTPVEIYKEARNAVPTFSCAMARASILRECDFNPMFKPALDLWVWAQAVTKTKFSFVDLPLVHWRQHEQSYMKKSVKPGHYDSELIKDFKAKIMDLAKASKVR